jgi:hypothetical protein
MNPTTPSRAPMCRHLRTKRMHVPVLAAGALERHLLSNDDSFYTCTQTLSVLGCDDDAVHPRACCPGRSCYRA